MRNGQWLDCAGAMRFLPDPPEVELEWFEIRTDAGGGKLGSQFPTVTSYQSPSGFVERYCVIDDRDDDEDTAKLRAVILCGLLGQDVWVVKFTRWDDGSDDDEECVVHYTFDADEKTVGEA